MTGRTDTMFETRPTNPRPYENGKKAKRSFAEIDSGAGLSRLPNEEERVAGRRLHLRRRNLLLPGLRRRHRLHLPYRRQDRLLPPWPETDEGRNASRRATLRRPPPQRRTQQGT